MKALFQTILLFTMLLGSYYMVGEMTEVTGLPVGLRVAFYAAMSCIIAYAFWLMEQKCNNEKSALERKKVETSKDIGRLLAVAGLVYKTKDPTNADMRELRKELVTLVISQIKRGESLKGSDLEAIPPQVLRDVVQEALEENVIDLSKDNTPEMAKLLKHAFSTGVSGQGGFVSA